MTSNGEFSPKKRYDLIWKCLDDDKAEDILSFDLAEKSHLADYMIIATGRASTHLKALANSLQKNRRDFGVENTRIEGQNMADWIIVDLGDVIVHLFREEVREFYDLEKLWDDCLMNKDGNPASLLTSKSANDTSLEHAQLS